MGRAQGAGPWAGPKEPTDAKTGTLRKAYATPLVLRNPPLRNPLRKALRKGPTITFKLQHSIGISLSAYRLGFLTTMSTKSMAM